MNWQKTGRLVGAFLLSALVAGGAVAQDKSKWPKSLTLGTASVGGTYFIYGGVLAQLLTEKVGVNVSTQQTQGPNQNMLLVDGGKVELGMITMGVGLHGWNGTGWAKQQHRNARAMFPMYDTPFHFVATERSGVKTVADLAGKRVGVGPRAGTPGTYFPLMFEALGVQNVTIRNGGASDMASQLQDGLIDVFAFAAGVPISAFSELEAKGGVRFFTFTDAEIATLRQKIPELSPSVIPKGTYRTQTEDHRTVGLYNFAIAHKDLPADLVYEMVKAVMDNNKQMVQGHSAASETIPTNADKNTFLPFHPGAVKYFQEKGIKLNPVTVSQ
jgi:uncharacterized protein